MLKRIAGAASLVFMCLLAPAEALEIKEVVSTSPSWDTFTNEDGTGLYHELLRKIFGQYGITVRHDYAKTNRADELVRLEMADMMTCDDRPENSLIQSRYPMYVNDFHAFYKKGNIGVWQGDESLRNKRLVAQAGYYYLDNFSVPVMLREVLTGEQALIMVLMGRADCYIDDKVLIRQSLEKNREPFAESEYAIEKVGRRAYYPLFNSSERGQEIKRLYEDGIIKAHKAGLLKPIYEKWGYQYPDFDTY